MGEYTDEDGCFAPQPDMPLLANRYRFLRILGKGQSSVLVRVKDVFQDNTVRAVKVLHTHYSLLGVQESDCIRRINLADPYDTSGTLRFCNAFSYHKHYCMVFELLSPEPLTDYFKDMCVNKVISAIRKVALRLLQALGFLQQQNVIHADLKPANILLKKEGDLNTLKVVDFGNAIHCIHEEMSLYYEDFELQTLLYRAPEVVFGLPFGLEVDMWSLGCVLAELYIARPLFCGSDKMDTMTNTTDLLGPLPEEVFKRGKFFSELSRFTCPSKDIELATTPGLMEQLECNDYAFVDFLRLLLHYNPNERLTVADAARHPFLAPEIGLGYIMPSSSEHAYPLVLLDHQNYTKRPFIDEHRKRRRLSSAELLREGTYTLPTAAPKVKVARVMPMPKCQNNNNIIIQEPASVQIQTTLNRNIVPEESAVFSSTDVTDKDLTYKSIGLKRKVKIVQQEMHSKARNQWFRDKAKNEHPSNTQAGPIHCLSLPREPPPVANRHTTELTRSTQPVAGGRGGDQQSSTIKDVNGHSHFHQSRSGQQIVSVGRVARQSETVERLGHRHVSEGRENHHTESAARVSDFIKPAGRISYHAGLEEKMNNLSRSAGRVDHQQASLGRMNTHAESVGRGNRQREYVGRLGDQPESIRRPGLQTDSAERGDNARCAPFVHINRPRPHNTPLIQNHSTSRTHNSGITTSSSNPHPPSLPSSPESDRSGHGDVNLLSPGRDIEAIGIVRIVQAAPVRQQTALVSQPSNSPSPDAVHQEGQRWSNGREQSCRNVHEAAEMKVCVQLENTKCKLEVSHPRHHSGGQPVSTQQCRIPGVDRPTPERAHKAHILKNDDDYPPSKKASQTKSQTKTLGDTKPCGADLSISAVTGYDRLKGGEIEVQGNINYHGIKMPPKHLNHDVQSTEKPTQRSRAGHQDGREGKQKAEVKVNGLARSPTALTKATAVRKVVPKDGGTRQPAAVSQRPGWDRLKVARAPDLRESSADDSCTDDLTSSPDPDGAVHTEYQGPGKRSAKRNLLDHYSQSPAGNNGGTGQHKKKEVTQTKDKRKKTQGTREAQQRKKLRVSPSPTDTKHTPSQLANRRQAASPSVNLTPSGKRKRRASPVICVSSESDAESDTSQYLPIKQAKKRNKSQKMHPATPKHQKTPNKMKTPSSGSSGKSRSRRLKSPDQVDEILFL